MDKDELLKKDWQLLTAYSLMSHGSFLRTILENQNFIISKLTNIPLSEITKHSNEYLDDNYKKVVKMIKPNIPNYPLEGRNFV